MIIPPLLTMLLNNINNPWRDLATLAFSCTVIPMILSESFSRYYVLLGRRPPIFAFGASGVLAREAELIGF
jgi:hypothetical protein